MSYSMSIRKTVTLAGESYVENTPLTANNLAASKLTIPAAKSGTLDVRTDANTGTLVMGSGHGITTGARLDLYWASGCRRGIVVGTVSGTSVPIDLGSGDDLPSAATAITAMVPTEIEVNRDGSDLEAYVFASDSRGQLVIEDGSAAEILALEVRAGGVLEWSDGDGTDNPVTGNTMATVYLSHSNSTASSVVKFGLLLN